MKTFQVSISWTVGHINELIMTVKETEFGNEQDTCSEIYTLEN